MSASPSPSAHPVRGSRLLRSRTCRLLVGTGAVAALVVAGSPASFAAGTATSGPTSAAGNLLDATLGGSPIDQLAKLKYAKAVAPGEAADNNPLDVTALGALNLPLTGVLNFPTSPAIDAGVVNQYADAKENGTATGAAGAVSNTGGVNLNSTQANANPIASIDLDANALKAIGGASAIPGLGDLSIPGLGALLPSGDTLPGLDAAALGGVHLKLGAVYAKATAAKGKVAAPQYGIANVQLQVGSPLLGSVLKQILGAGNLLNDGLGGLLGPLTSATGPLNKVLDLLGSSNPLLSGLHLDGVVGGLTDALGKCTGITVDKDITLADGGVVIDGSDATVTVDVAKILKALGLDLNNLPANTDLLAYVLHELPTILYNLVNGALDTVLKPLVDQFNTCLSALQDGLSGIDAVPGLGGILNTVLGTVFSALQDGSTQLLALKDTIASQLEPFVTQLQSAFAGGIDALSNALAMLVDIGVNVQSGPGAAKTNSEYPYESALAPTVKQGEDALAGKQTLVRALEVKVAGAASGGLGSGLGGGLPGISSLTDLLGGLAPAGVVAPLAAKAAAPGDGLLAVALASAAVAPGAAPTPSQSSSSPAPSQSTTPTTPDTEAPTTPGAPDTNVPTKVDAGKGLGGTPVAPLVLLLAGLVLAGAGTVTWRLRIGRHGA